MIVNHFGDEQGKYSGTVGVFPGMWVEILIPALENIFFIKLFHVCSQVEVICTWIIIKVVLSVATFLSLCLRYFFWDA